MFSMIRIMLLVWSPWMAALNPLRSDAQAVPARRTFDNVILPAMEQPDSSEDSAESRRIAPTASPQTARLIVIGFVGGSVNRDGTPHPEIQLGKELRRRYSSGVYLEVFGNHHREAAHRQVLQWLDTNADGALSAEEKRQARVIIYGHNSGASEALALARELGHRNIPVLLTIQVESIAKTGHYDGSIPPNVANAVNFYQPDGLLHGCPAIAAVDPYRTKILGNFRMNYSDQPIRPGDSSWFARLFIMSHIQIEDDSHIWQQAAALIDKQFGQPTATNPAQAPND